MLPLGDDNRDRRSWPVVTIALIAVNVLIFVVFQSLGANDNFTYAWSTVPQEILTGKDVVTQDTTFQDPVTGQSVVAPGLRPTRARSSTSSTAFRATPAGCTRPART